MTRIWRAVWPPLSMFAAFVAALEAGVRAGLVQEFLFPAPSVVAATLIESSEILWAGFFSTALSACLGLGLSFLFGSFVAIVLAGSDFMRRAFLPYAIFFQTVPVISVAPLLVIWFGFGRPTVVASAFIVSVFPVIASTLLGLRSTDPALVDLFRLYSARSVDLVFRLRIPFALPQIFSGLRIASGLAVIGAIVGEFIAGGGLGEVVDVARTQQRVDLVFAAVLISSLLGLAMVGSINLLAWLTLRRWHASAQA